MTARIIVLDDLSADGLAVLDAAPDLGYEIRTGLKGTELKAVLTQFDGAICRSGVKLTADVLQGNTRLRAVVRAGVGTDNIDKDAATRLGILVMNTPGGNTISTAEHAIALMLGMARNVAPAYAALMQGRWDRKNFMGTQLAGKTLGIIGLGRIGQTVAARALAMEMKILGYDPFLSTARAKELGIQMFASAKEMFPLVDFLTVHTPLNDETRGLVDAEAIGLMKPGVRLVNCARGGIYDEAALVEGLKSGRIAGVALDVYENEPCVNSPLFGLPGVLCTPHLGASTEEAQTNVAVEAAELLVDYFTTGTIRQAVNMSPLDAKTLEGLREYLNVAYRLGLLLAQLDQKRPSRCRLVYRGEVARKDTRLLSSAFAAGLLEHALDTGVNIVNARVLLQERGIELVEESSSDPSSFSSMITAELIGDEETRTASGTLFGNNMPRLVQMAGCDMESYLDGTLMIFEHRDTPGMIGQVGSVFGAHRVNIAQMSVGRKSNQPGGAAVGILALDGQPPSTALEEVRSLSGIRRASVVNLPPAGELPAWLGGR